MTTLAGKKKLTPEQKAAQKAEKERRLALVRLTGKKERKRIAKRAKKARKKLKSATGFVGDLNDGKQPTLPLTEAEEKFRQLSVAGDFAGMNAIVPFGPNNWRKITPLGKYRFMINSNGGIKYIPWSDDDIVNFLNGPWFTRNPQTGIAPLIHPRRKKGIDKNFKIKQWMKRRDNALKFPENDMRHVSPINVGEYVFKSGLDSTWVQVRAPVMTAVAAVASVYFGPQVLAAVKAKIASLGASGAAAGGASGASAATTGAKIAASAQQITKYANNARTIKAIAEGKEPPPPIELNSKAFTDWAMKEAAAEIGEKMTKEQEQELRREIEQLQREIARTLPPGTITQPSPELTPAIRDLQMQEKKNADMLKTAALIGIPLLLLGAG